MRGIGFYGYDFFIIKEDIDLVSESIGRLFNTNNNERLNNPYMGVDLKRFLFQLADEDSEDVIKNQITEQIEMYEPRVNVKNISIENLANENTFKIGVSFVLKEDPQSDQFLEFNIIREEE
ncbi:MAG: GPW/gp25 family protein [Halanaerobiales bacterium]